MTRSNDVEWSPPKDDPEWRQKIVEEFHIHPILAQILVTRGFTSLKSIHAFLYVKLRDLHDPFLFVDMEAAVNRLARAWEAKERVMVYGDTDVDGMTAAALLVEFLRSIGVDANPYLPGRSTRQSEMIEGLKAAQKSEVTLVITVDCGITAAEEIERFTESGIDVIVTDHHEPTHKIPNCLATLNPKLIDNVYPNRELTGAGVAFKLIHAVTVEFVKTKKIAEDFVDLESYLDLVALGTIADMAPLVGENRILAHYGLKSLEATKRIGLQKLFEVCGINPKSGITAFDVASKLAPRLNSIGRIDEGSKGVELLLASSEAVAQGLAEELELQNIERQRIEKLMSEHLDQMIQEDPAIMAAPMIVVASDKWHPGVIPILSARLTKQYAKPTLLIAIENGVGKGSLRTVPEFPLLPMLKANAEYLIDFGGHDFAAGMTIQEKDIKAFTKAALDYAEKNIPNETSSSTLQIDANVSFYELDFELLESLDLFKPYGQENPMPIFFAQAEQSWPPKVVSSNHLKMYVQEGGRMLEGIAFGMADRREELKRKNIKLDLAFTPQVNRFLNKSSIQLLIRGFQTDT